MNSISLKYRIAVTIFMLEAVMVTLVLWRVQTVSYNEVTSSLHERHEIYLGLLADRGREALVTTEYGELQNYVERSDNMAAIKTIFMIDHRKVIVVSSDPALLSRTLPSLKDDESGHWDMKDIALESAGGNIGSIYIKFSNDRIRAAHRKSILQGMIIAGFSMVVIAVAGIMIGSILVRRLERLQDSTRKMADGNLDIQADISGADEVSRLADTFNAMTQTIKSSMKSLTQSEKGLQEAQRVAHVGSWQWTVATDTVHWSEELYRINGLNPKLPPPGYAEMASCYTPESWKRLNEAVTRALQSGASYELDLEIVRPDNTTRHTAARGEAVYDADGKLEKLQGTVQDITERRKAEETLRMSEARLREITDNMVDLVAQFDEKAFYLYVSPSYEKVLGYRPEELIGTWAPALLHPDDRATAIQAIDSMLRSNSDNVEFRFQHKDGGYRWIESTGRNLMNAEGQVIGSVMGSRDITERKKIEKLLLRSLKEKEVMLKEIHHRVKNNMQVIYSLLNLQAKGVTDRTVRALLEEGRDRVLSMAMIHEKLYQSKDLAHIDFKEYLQGLVHSIARTYKRQNVVIELDMGPVPLDVNTGIPCGLIVNELVTNSLKYAFPDGEKGTITVGMSKNSDGDHVLIVADNGVGFPETVDFRNTSSLGLQLVSVLTGQLLGTLELAKAEGTRFSITFPGK